MKLLESAKGIADGTAVPQSGDEKSHFRLETLFRPCIGSSGG
jgi:hypothetical protein